MRIRNTVLACVVVVLLATTRQSHADGGCCEDGGPLVTCTAGLDQITCKNMGGFWIPNFICLPDQSACVSKESIPTVSEWGIGIMVILVLTAGTIVFSRRRPCPA